jgi:hypothetical protein
MRRTRTARSVLSDIGWLFLVVWALPIVLLVLGLPFAGAIALIHRFMSW